MKIEMRVRTAGTKSGPPCLYSRTIHGVPSISARTFIDSGSHHKLILLFVTCKCGPIHSSIFKNSYHFIVHNIVILKSLKLFFGIYRNEVIIFSAIVKVLGVMRDSVGLIPSIRHPYLAEEWRG